MAIFFGDGGNDNIPGTPQDDIMLGFGGNDTLDGRGGSDNILGGAGNDRLLGQGGNDRLVGESGNDSLNGGDGQDILVGGNGTDTLTGGQGNDILVGGIGNENDTLTGGGGADRFGFAFPSEGIDTITDFVVRDDTIVVSASGFRGGLRQGATITPDQFRYGSAAGDAQDRFIYNPNTGALFFDVDGTGSANQVRIATLSNKALITNADIFVSREVNFS